MLLFIAKHGSTTYNEKKPGTLVVYLLATATKLLRSEGRLRETRCPYQPFITVKPQSE
jgi:hypothetical protein